ncbi:hypothetical protein Lal_00044706 [Lupinus albus]|nr:hypothetical protein Lal_00044706 [Lupinus albus]
MVEQICKKKKITKKCPSMSLDNFLNNNVELEDEQECEDGHEGGDEHEGEDVQEGATSKIKRGKTKCLEVHAQSLEDRAEIIFNEFGVPIEPDQKTVIQFSNFLGTIARSSDFCPLVYTNSKIHHSKCRKKVVFAILNDAWRRHKCVIREEQLMLLISIKNFYSYFLLFIVL